VVQGQTVTVGLREKKSWEQHTTEEQRNNPNFKTAYGDQIIEKSKSLGEPTVKENLNQNHQRKNQRSTYQNQIHQQKDHKDRTTE